jgi:hypothetical protein
MLTIDFCNIRESEWTHERILALNREHSIAYTIGGLQKGHENLCRSKYDGGGRTFWLIEDKDAKELNDGTWVFPSDEASSELWFCLQHSQKEFKGFLDSCAKGNPDIGFLNDAIEDFSRVGFQVFKPEVDTGLSQRKQQAAEKNLSITNKLELRNLEDHINAELLTFVFEKKAVEFYKFQRCHLPGCGKYFLKPRSDRKYCCREHAIKMAGINFKKENPGYMTEYMRKYPR